ncbi:TRAP transporter small permease [Ornithinibacillus massiliensis]|uniref:TRAP transporter small permease n=1 Tax=Ornithinibacillus massiliensis TaxID=1944633 RepID=A0ABS5MAQ4_9BACI|nr:TRAP transporter small permease [Ornithinibacillus massiliensis]
MAKWFNRLEEIIVVLALVVMSIIAFSNVITRNFFDLSLSFTEEVTINLFVLLTFIGTSIGVRKNAHLGFSLIYDKSPESLKRILTIIIGVISVSIFGLFSYFGFEMVQFQLDMNSTTPALGWPRWIFSLGLPIGALLCAIRSVEAVIKEWKELSQEGTT